MQRIKNNFIKVLVSVMILAAVFSSGVLTKVSAAEVTSEEYVNYVLNDNFTEYNAGNWSLYQEQYLSGTVPPQYTDPISISGGLTISNDYTEKNGEYQGARMVSNVRFAQDPSRPASDNYTIFETSFVVYQNNKENRGRDVSYGFLFGLPEKDSRTEQGAYFKFDSACFYLYSEGQLVEPEYANPEDPDSDNSLGGYIEYDFKLEVNLVAKSNGDLLVYLGFPDGKSISELFCTYKGLDFEGYVGYMATSHESQNRVFSVNFDSIKLSGGTVADYNFEVVSVSCKADNLASAIVSDKPIPLEAEIITAPNLLQYHRAVFSVISGEAEIRNGNELYIHSTEPIVVRAQSLYDSSKYSDYTVNAIQLEVSSIEFQNTFDNITVYTQPFRLIAKVNSNSYLPAHNEVKYEIISGNAEIYCDKYLKINGAGTVILRATSTLLDEAFTTVTFEVTDPDAAYVPTEEGSASSCRGMVDVSFFPCALLLAAAGVCILFRKKVSNKNR